MSLADELAQALTFPPPQSPDLSDLLSDFEQELAEMEDLDLNTKEEEGEEQEDVTCAESVDEVCTFL